MVAGSLEERGESFQRANLDRDALVFMSNLDKQLDVVRDVCFLGRRHDLLGRGFHPNGPNWAGIA